MNPYIPKASIIRQPRWLLGFRLLQAIFAIIVLGLTAYGLSRDRGGPVRPFFTFPFFCPSCTILTNSAPTPPHRNTHHRSPHNFPNRTAYHRSCFPPPSADLRSTYRVGGRGDCDAVVVWRVCRPELLC